MKKVVVLGFIALFACLFVTSQAMALTYDVTANYGIRVSQKGACEQVGSISIMPQGGASSVNHWTANVTITVELLAGATLCKTIPTTLYSWGGTQVATVAAANYRVYGTKGDDYFRIDVLTTDAAGSTNVMLFGHDVASMLCFNLANTPYVETDPNLQLVQVSYKDTMSNTYSGDSYVATVKKTSPHGVVVCAKTTEGATLVGTTTTAIIGHGDWPTGVDKKTGLPQIKLCDPGATAQAQGATCGVVAPATQVVCIKIEDAAGNFTNSRYDFTVGKTGASAKQYVGINSVTVYSAANPVNALATVVDARRKVDGTATALAVETAEIDFHATLAGSGAHFVVLTVAYDSCNATPGDWVIDVSGSRNPCGDSFKKENISVATFVNCATGAAKFTNIFPYVPSTTGAWWGGLVLTNPNNAAITVALEMYEADGAKYTASISVPAMGAVVGLVNDSNFMTPALATGSTDSAFFDETFWMKASCDKDFYGFLMLGDGTQAQGYLPIK